MADIPITTVLDHKIRLWLPDLPGGIRESIAEALTIPNVAKLEAQKNHQWGWERMPDNIAMYSIEDDYMVMPRGFIQDYADGLRLLGYRPQWIDCRKFKRHEYMGEEIDLRAWQKPAKSMLYAKCDGIYKAPAGSGKTVAILALIQELSCKSLIIVNTKDVLWQWQERIDEFLGPDYYPVGQIGDGVFDISDQITIATAQTLHSRFHELEQRGFFDDFSLVCLDECHHATAETYNRVLDRFSARYRLGVSATPDKTGDFALATLVLGPIVHTTYPYEVTSLMRPQVVKVHTKFGFGFRGTKSRWQRSNYGEMIQALITDQDRNQLIVNQIKANVGHHQMVLSKRLDHLYLLEGMLEEQGFADYIVKITGQTKNEDRLAAKRLAETSPCVLLSTVADEALDIPRLDRLHLCFPQKNAGLVTQQVGRVERKHPDKLDAIIYDYIDGNVGPLEKQWRTRRFDVYEPRGYEIHTMPRS